MAKDISAAFQLDGSLDESAVGVYGKALSTVARENFSYVELRTAVRKLVARGMSEGDALASVLVTAETMGASGGALLKSAEAHLKRLDTERDKIAAAMQKRLTEGMAKDRQRVEAAVKQQADLKLQMAALEKSLAAAEAKERELRATLASTEERVQRQGEQLDAAYEAFKREISGDVEAIRRVAG